MVVYFPWTIVCGERPIMIKHYVFQYYFQKRIQILQKANWLDLAHSGQNVQVAFSFGRYKQLLDMSLVRKKNTTTTKIHKGCPELFQRLFCWRTKVIDKNSTVCQHRPLRWTFFKSYARLHKGVAKHSDLVN